MAKCAYNEFCKGDRENGQTYGENYLPDDDAHVASMADSHGCQDGLVPLADAAMLLFEASRDARESRIEDRTKPLNDDNDRDRDAGRDNAVLNRGRATFVAEERKDELGHGVHLPRDISH